MTKQPTRKAVGEALGITTNRVHQLIESGQFPRKGTMQDYIDANDRRSATGNDQLDLTSERARVAKEHADKLEMENAVKRGELIPAETAAEVLRSEYQRASVKLQALPTKLAPLIVGSKSLAEVQDILSDGIGEALDELSRPDAVH
jgi:hypothetical protein